MSGSNAIGDGLVKTALRIIDKLEKKIISESFRNQIGGQQADHRCGTIYAPKVGVVITARTILTLLLSGVKAHIHDPRVRRRLSWLRISEGSSIRLI